jgi:hypothetical protein
MKIGFFSLLTLLLIAAKLFGYVTWSWWIVLLPLWLPMAFFVAILAIVGVGYLIVNSDDDDE